MQTIRLNLEALEVNSFVTTATKQFTVPRNAAPTDFCGSAVSETNGYAICKSCGPCCN